MARIQFKGKVQTMRNADDDSAVYEYIQVPAFDRKHCDMNAFRRHKKYGPYANSDLFKGMLNRIRKDVFGGQVLKLNAIPEGVQVDASGFLAVVTLDV
mgnify:FL=1